jgi:hypothetical protein
VASLCSMVNLVAWTTRSSSPDVPTSRHLWS